MDESLLIHLVQGFPNIYDKSRKDFRDKQKKENSWSHISVAMGESVTVEECQRVWKLLRERYAREKKIQNPPSGSEAVDSQWVYFKQLMFLEKHIKMRRKTTSNYSKTPTTSHPVTIEINDEISEDVTSQEFDESELIGIHQLSESSSSCKEAGITPRRPRKRKRSEMEDELISAVSTLAEQFKTENAMNADMAFGRYVGLQISELPKHLKNSVKRRITSIFEELDTD